MKKSVILTSKNDNYGGNLHHRATMCLTSLIEHHDEVIFVDWKTKNNDSIINSIRDKLSHQKKLKSIQVSKQFLQEKYPNISKYNIIESIGRNIGIRRAEGDYIISTNIDIISSPLTESLLNENIFYTVPRRDVDENFHLNFNSFQNLYNSIWDRRDSYQPKEKSNSTTDIWSLINCCGDYQIGFKDVWEKMKGFEESILFGCGIDTNVMKKASFYSQIKTLDEHYIFHLNHGKSSDRDEDEEIPPMSNQNEIIQNFTNTGNSDEWGMSNEDLPIEII
jgi:hypothetical protein